LNPGPHGPELSDVSSTQTEFAGFGLVSRTQLVDFKVISATNLAWITT
jgi:hypothetical protein